MQNFTLNNSNVLITGGTGSWGHELVRQILEKFPDVNQIRIYSRNEHKQVSMKEQFNNHPKLKFIIGDVRDKEILLYAMKNVDIVFHLAALKHVPVCEDNSWETVLTNIYGTQNVIEAAIANKVVKVVDVSTDKAVDPFNIYGVSKACGEKLIINANFNYSFNHTDIPQFIGIRGGNVLGTNGSVIPLFKKQLKETNQITVTDPNMTRYLMSTREAIGLIFTAVENSIGGEMFVMKMPGTRLENLINVMIKLFGNSNTKIKHMGVRPGEKKHEVLISKNEAPFARVYSDKYYVILPQIVNDRLIQHYDSYPKIEINEFTSQNTKQLDELDLESMLKKEAWLWQ